MRLKRFFAPLVFLLTASTPSAAETPAADLILTNGHIHGPSETYEALAVRRGVIVALGTEADLAEFQGKTTQTIDLDGKSVLPGFYDTHVHPVFGGFRQTECKILQGSDLTALQNSVRGCVERAKDGAWITGGQWDAYSLGGAPDKEMLDVLTQSIPILLSDTSGHSALANSAALKIAGLTRTTEAPEGGIIERGPDGEPTGVLRESAIDLVRRHVPPPTAQEMKDALAYSLKLMLSYGITSFTEASLGFTGGAGNEITAYTALADEGILKQRARLCLNWAPNNPDFQYWIDHRNIYARELVRPDCIKMFLDGVPTDSHTAAMVEPYADTVDGRDDDASRYGLLLVPQELLNDAVAHFDRTGMSVKFHAAGDAAVRAGINAVEYARRVNGVSGTLHDVGHATFVHRDDYGRARKANVVMELSPYLWSPSPINDDITRAVGFGRAGNAWPFRDLLDAGEMVVAGSDWSVVPSVNPWPAIEGLLTRASLGGRSSKTFGGNQKITIKEALSIFTENGARYAGDSNRLGRLELGLLADMIVVDQNPYETETIELHKTKVTHTFINGELVYEREN